MSSTSTRIIGVLLLAALGVCAVPAMALAPAPEPARARELASYLGRLHPLAVHFPIALILAAAAAEGLALRRRAPTPDAAARFCITLGAAGALLAAPLGWMAANTALVPYDPDWALAVHRWLGISTATLALVAAVSARSHTLGRWYRPALFASAATVAVAAHFGGLLAYGMGYLSW